MKPTDADRERAEQWHDSEERSWLVVEQFEHDGSFIDELATLIAQVRAEERERCARVAEEYFDSDRATPELRLNAAVLAAAIREGES